MIFKGCCSAVSSDEAVSWIFPIKEGAIVRVYVSAGFSFSDGSAGSVGSDDSVDESVVPVVPSVEESVVSLVDELEVDVPVETV